jgi:hypothetical protein
MADVRYSRDWIDGPSLSNKSVELISFTLETSKTKMFGGLQCYDVPGRFVEVHEWSKLFLWSNICSHSRTHTPTHCRDTAYPSFATDINQIWIIRKNNEYSTNISVSVNQRVTGIKRKDRLLTVPCYCY